MTQDEIIEMADKANVDKGARIDELFAFAKLVAAKEREHNLFIYGGIRDMYEATVIEIGKICGEDLSDEPRAKWALLEVAKLKDDKDKLLHLFQEWKEDHLSQYNYIEAVEAIRARGEA